MTFKLFRRGSARCIGLLSAFITILLCLYYISMGQPSTTIQPNKEQLQASLLTGQQQQQATLLSSANGGGGGVGGVGNNQQQQQHYNKNYASHKIKHSSNSNNYNNEDNIAPAAAPAAPSYTRQHKLIAKAAYNNDPALQQLDTGAGAGAGATTGGSGGSGTSGSGSTTYSFASGMYVNNPQWGDKCYILDESDTNITAQEEYAKFDFQVKMPAKT